MSKLMPPEGSPRRLSGYPTYAFGYGNAFFIAFDSNIAADALQLAWVTDQLEHLDRARYPPRDRVLPSPAVLVGSARRRLGRADAGHRREGAGSPRAADRRDSATLHAAVPEAPRRDDRRRSRSSLRSLGRALRSTTARTYRMDALVTGGGGAPIYTYAGEPDLRGVSRRPPRSRTSASSTW